MGIFNQIFGQGFDPSTVDPADSFDVLPPGKYPVVIEKAEVKATKARTGHYLELYVSITDGPNKGRKLWPRLNIHNPSEVAQRIGQANLASLCTACGVGVIQDEAQLVGKTCIANVKVKDEQNEVRSWSASNDAVPITYQAQKPPPVASSADVATKPARTTPPWVR